MPDSRIYDHRELEKLSPSDRQMLLTFGTFVPRSARFPHCIMYHEFKELREVLRVVGGKAGIWGPDPLVDSLGQPFLPPEDGDMTGLFDLWELPENQQQVADFARQDSILFSMLIDTKTPDNVLSELYKFDVQYDDYYFYLNQLSEWIENLRWAYVPLEYEGMFALFVTPNHGRQLVEEVREALQRAGCVVFSLAQRGERWHWDGPTERWHWDGPTER